LKMKTGYWFMVLLPVLEPSKRTWKPQSWNPFVRFWIPQITKKTEAEMADVEKLIEKWKKMMT
jgi:hypothetical protein